MNDIYGNFLKDFNSNKLKGEVLLHNNYGIAEELPIEAFFRDEEDMPDVEIFALNLCKGSVLDVGAGTGGHSLILQRNGFDVDAVEISSGACEVMRIRGVKKILNTDVWILNTKKYDTLLLMMNGIGFCGYVDELKKFLIHAKNLILRDGQILFDSSDVSYLYEDGIPADEDTYYGEIDYQYEYDGDFGEWFSWLYIDANYMKDIAHECGWLFQKVYEDEDDHYLARLVLNHDQSDDS